MSAVVLSESRPLARKRYVCDACQRTIEPGTRTYVQGVVYDGRLGTWRTHNDCDRIIRLHWREIADCDGIPHACLEDWDGLDEEIAALPPESP